MVSEVKWTKSKNHNKENGKSKHAIRSRPQNGLDWGCWLASKIQRLERGGGAPHGHGTITYQKCRYKDEICDLMGRKGSQDILEHFGTGQSRQSQDYPGQSWGITKPKSDEIAAFTHLRALNQGNKTLSSYIQEVRRMVDLCNFSCVGDCKDRLIRNSIVAGLSSTKAYQQCISKGSNLTLNECIRICQTEDATHRQVQALRPESTDCNDSTPIHHITELPQARPRTSFRAREDTEGPTEAGDPARGVAWEEPGPRETTDIVPRLHVATVAHGPTEQEKNAEPQAKSASIVVKLDIFQSVQTKAELSTEWQDCSKAHWYGGAAPRLLPEWVHNPILHHKRTSKSPNKVPQDYSQSPSYTGQRYRTHQNPYGYHSLEEPQSYKPTVR